MPKFTPGPWYVAREEGPGETVDIMVRDEATSAAIAWVGPSPLSTDIPPTSGECMANAQLVAKAPELRELLQRLVLSPLSGELEAVLKEAETLAAEFLDMTGDEDA